MYKMIFNERIKPYKLKNSDTESQCQLNNFKNFFNLVNNDYIHLMEKIISLEFMIDNEQYAEIWYPARPIKIYEDYQFDKYLPKAIPIAGDGGDNVLVYYSKNQEVPKIYITELGDLDEMSLIFVANELNDILFKGIGLNVIKNF